MELLGALSNPETSALLLRVGEAVDGLGSLVAKSGVVLPERRPAQGEIVWAISDVPIAAPGGLRTSEVWDAVDGLLDRPVQKSTIKGLLAGNPKFIRLRRGLYGGDRRVSWTRWAPARQDRGGCVGARIRGSSHQRDNQLAGEAEWSGERCGARRVSLVTVPAALIASSGDIQAGRLRQSRRLARRGRRTHDLHPTSRSSWPFGTLPARFD
jgi:hypothetical protein